jgi:integrase
LSFRKAQPATLGHSKTGGLFGSPSGSPRALRSTGSAASWVGIGGGLGKGREALVFTTERGDVLRNSNYRKRYFAPAVAKCQNADENFPTITPHDLRHTAASLAVSAGANVKALQRMLGHAKASMTLDVYADLFDDDLDDVADSLDTAIKAAAKISCGPTAVPRGQIGR